MRQKEPTASSFFLLKSGGGGGAAGSLRCLCVISSEIRCFSRGVGMPVGIVKLFSRSRGYGFIRPDEGGGDVFVHRTALEEMGLKALSKGQRGVFDVREEHGKLVAKNLRVELDESLSQSETLIPQLQLVDVEIDTVTENLNSADRKLISRADLEQSLTDAVREISPECGAFVG